MVILISITPLNLLVLQMRRKHECLSFSYITEIDVSNTCLGNRSTFLNNVQSINFNLVIRNIM